MTTDKLLLANTNVGTSGWDTIIDTNMQKIDDAISTIEIIEYGESIDEYEAVYIKPDGLAWLAEADGTKQPAFGVAIDTGVATDEKRIRTSGIMTNASWTWTEIGQYLYLDDSTPGALTETLPSDNAQIIGVILSATEIFVNPSVAQVRPLQIGGTFNGVTTANIYLCRLPISEHATFPADMEGSLFYAETTATASTVFSLRKIAALDQSDSEFATATFLPDTTIDNAAAVDKGSGEVGIPITGHGMSVGQKVILSGTTNYDGTYAIQSQTVNEIVITATYVAETFAGTEGVLMNNAFFVAATATSFIDGDILVVKSPASPDATLADFGFNIIGSRTA